MSAPVDGPAGPPAQLRGTAAVVLASCGWGTWALWLRGSGLAAAWQAALVAFAMAAALLPAALRDGRRARARGGALSGTGSRPRRPWGLLALLGALDVGNLRCFFAGVDRGPIAVAVLTHYLAPVVVAAAAPALLGEPLGRRTPPALLASLAGLALLLLGGGSTSLAAARPAALLGGASALFYGANTLLGKRLLGPFSPAEVISWHSWVSTVALVALALLNGPPPALHSVVGLPLFGALFAGAGGSVLFYAGLRAIPAQRAAVLTYLEPVVAAIVGALAFHERLPALSWLGAVVILVAGAAVAFEAAPAPPLPEPGA